MSTRRLDFTDHSRELAQNRYVYGVISRRARGLSIGINLNPDKVCNFDCPYCQVDRTGTAPDGTIVLERLEQEIDHLLSLVVTGRLWDTAPFDTAAPELRQVIDLAFAGDGEPTSPALFPDAARLIRQRRDAFGVRAPIRLITNATLLHLDRVKAGLADIDEPWCKLDAGTEDFFRMVDGTSFPFARILKNLAELAATRPIVLQSMFHCWEGAGPPDAEIEAWVERIKTIKEAGEISLVQVYTVARPPADKRVTALDHARLEEIAAAVRAIGVHAVAY